MKYTNHPSIIAIQKIFKGGDGFCFRELEKEEIQKEIHNLNNNKVSQHSDIPTKIIKRNSDIFNDFLYVSTNSSIKSFLFPSCLKTANIAPMYNNGKRDLKDNYRPLSILPVWSKLYERSMFKLISEFFKIFSQKINVDSGKTTSQINAS